MRGEEKIEALKHNISRSGETDKGLVTVDDKGEKKHYEKQKKNVEIVCRKK